MVKTRSLYLTRGWFGTRVVTPQTDGRTDRIAIYALQQYLPVQLWRVKILLVTLNFVRDL